MRKVYLSGWLFFGLLFCLPLFCQAEPQLDRLPMVYEQLKAAASATQSLASDFVQEKHLAIFAEPLLSRGRFVYRQPDHLRWELQTPVISGFVLRGSQGERWNGLSGEVGSFRADTDPIMGIVSQQLLAWAKVDIDWLQSRYRIELLAEQPVRLQLFPLATGEADFIDQLQILFSTDSRHVARVEMYEKGGDKTILRFEAVAINQPLAADAFQVPEL